jgi:predicted phosphodiesterase
MILQGRVGFIGDVHAEDALLETALTRLSETGVERILCTGDITDGPGSVDRACALLVEHHVVTVSGNHERWTLGGHMRDLPHATRRAQLRDETVAYLLALPATIELSTPRGRALLCHGMGTNDMAGVGPDDHGYAVELNMELQALLADDAVALVLNGHTHKPMVRHFPGLTIVNAGTLFRDHTPGYVMLDFESRDVTWHTLSDAAADRRLGSLSR